MIRKKELIEAEEKIKSFVKKIDLLSDDPYYSDYYFPFPKRVLDLIEKAKKNDLTAEEYKRLKEIIKDLKEITDEDSILQMELFVAIHALENTKGKQITETEEFKEEIDRLNLERFRELKKEIKRIFKKRESKTNKAILASLVSLVLSLSLAAVLFFSKNEMLVVPFVLISVAALYVAAKIAFESERLGNENPDNYPMLKKLSELAEWKE